MLNFKQYFSSVILEGGAAGHMAHPFNLNSIRTGNDLINFFYKVIDVLNNNPASLKIDGINTSFKLITDAAGNKQFAIDRGSMKPLDVRGVTIDSLEERFGPGHGMVEAGTTLLKILNSAIPVIKDELIQLGMWRNDNIFLNTEFVKTKTNVQEYDTNFLAIHGVNKFYQATARRRISEEIPYKKSTLNKLIDKLNAISKGYGFEVYGSVPAELDGTPNLEAKLNERIIVNIDAESTELKTLREWLKTCTNPRDYMINTPTGKKVGAVSKQVYLHILNNGLVSDIAGDDKKAQEKGINGCIIYHATRVLGQEILNNITTPMGSGSNHEGIVIRDEQISSKPVKITGNFIVRGMESEFR